jgi:VWFA-related protein
MMLYLLCSLLSQEITLRFTEPLDQTFAGRTRFALEVNAPEEDILGLELFINGRSVHYFDEVPFETEIDMSRYPEGDTQIKAVLLMFGDRQEEIVLKGKNFPHFQEEDVNLVRVPVMVEKLGGERFQTKDFSVWENERKQSVSFVFDEEKPIHLVALLDVSGSMDRHIPMLRRGMMTLIDSLKTDDSMQIIGFSHRIFEICPPETDKEVLKESLYKASTDGSTNLYGALWSGIKSAGVTNQRRALVVFTDGYHDLDGMPDPYKKSKDDCLLLAREKAVPIYAMGLGRAIQPEVLEEFADASGGRAYIVHNMKTVRRAFSDIAEELRHQYLVCYYTDSRKPGWHDIRIGLTGASHNLRYPQKMYFRR